jgi:hypothetical protein
MTHQCSDALPGKLELIPAGDDDGCEPTDNVAIHGCNTTESNGEIEPRKTRNNTKICERMATGNDIARRELSTETTGKYIHHRDTESTEKYQNIIYI